jgi:mono/diheme cytochrome c family protein
MRSSGLWRATRAILRKAAGAALRGAAPGLAVAGLLALFGCPDPPPPPKPPPDPDATIARVLSLTPDPKNGRIVFKSWCIFCHGDQEAGEPPTDFGLGDENPRKFRGLSDKLDLTGHVTAVIKGYVSQESGHQNMPSFLLRIPPQDIADVAAYERGVMALRGPYQEPEHRNWEGLPNWYDPILRGYRDAPLRPAPNPPTGG